MLQHMIDSLVIDAKAYFAGHGVAILIGFVIGAVVL